MPKERIGIMGGSFNPIHERHIELAACALREQKLNRMLFIPTGNPPHKHNALCAAEDRFEMTRLAVSGMDRCAASRIEIDREGVIYALDTLTRLTKQLPDAEFFYIIGEDTLFDLLNWYCPDKVFQLCRFLVSRRSSDSLSTSPILERLAQRGARLAFLTLPPKDISATAIREALAKGEEPPELKPQVMEYIRMTGLYGAKQSPPGAEMWYPKLKAALNEKRLVHSLLVSDTARRLARRHHVDENQAAAAALLHDCAKCLPLDAMQRVAKDNRLLLDKETLQSGNLLHGPVGAALAERVYGVTDPNVLSAIRCHTTGKVGMLPLDMIVFLSDKIEPSRRSYPMLESLRALADQSLTAAMRYSLRSSLQYVEKQKTTPHPLTKLAAQWFEQIDQSGIPLPSQSTKA